MRRIAGMRSALPQPDLRQERNLAGSDSASVLPLQRNKTLGKGLDGLRAS